MNTFNKIFGETYFIDTPSPEPKKWLDRQMNMIIDNQRLSSTLLFDPLDQAMEESKAEKEKELLANLKEND